MRSLTPAQEGALDLSRNLAVTAGAGSGKTTVLVERYLRVLSKLEARPHEVLAITFTKKAASEMRGRVIERLAATGAPASLCHEMTSAPISTIHAFCSAVLREFAVEAGIDPAFEVLEATEQKVLLRETIDDLLRERAAAPEGAPEAAPLEALATAFTRREVAQALEKLVDRRTLASRWARELLASSEAELVARWAAEPGAVEIARALEHPRVARDVAALREVAALPIPAGD
ncbi:MAG TPA: UvrD-helicase domain-containing protein, partial [Planctomycetota bacterium]|nr:UvrD-helicase domain-containing protein [Planctomycetota bacterium]